MPSYDDSPVRCMFLPLETNGLLVPSTGVAEIIGLSPPRELDEQPPWVAGLMNWRGVDIPLLTLERIFGGEVPPPGVRNRVAVMHVLDEDLRPAFYGIVIQRLPTVVLASERNLESNGSYEASWAHGALDLEVGQALIPNFERLEDELKQLVH